MGRIWVSGHYRNRRSPKRRNRGRGNSYLFRIMGIGILAFFVLYLLSCIPLQVFYTFFLLALLVLVSFATFKIYQVQHRRHLERENQAYQEHMQQVQSQYQQQTIEHQQAIAHYQSQALQQREHERVARIKTLGDILTLSAPEFEEFVGRLLSANGYNDVQRVGKSGDLGVDVTACDAQGNRVIVQCKRYGPGKSVGSSDLQKFLGMIVLHHQAKGIFVTTSTFTLSAREIAKDKPILLVDGDQLVKWVQNTRTL